MESTAFENTMAPKARLLVFNFDGHTFAFDAFKLTSIEQHSGLLINPEPSLIPINLLLGISSDRAGEYSHTLTFKAQNAAMSKILVNGPIDMVEASASSIYPIPDFIKHRLTFKNIKALCHYNGKYIFIINAA